VENTSKLYLLEMKDVLNNYLHIIYRNFEV